jgi:hypothetical protein
MRTLSIVMGNPSSSDPLEGPLKDLRRVIELAIDLNRGHHSTDRETDGFEPCSIVPVRACVVLSGCALITRALCTRVYRYRSAFSSTKVGRIMGEYALRCQEDRGYGLGLHTRLKGENLVLLMMLSIAP